MFNLVEFIRAAGYFGIFFIVFAESGLFVGFFLPGDSLLFTAGFLASQGFLNIWILALLSFFGAVIGDSFGYGFGKRVGPKIFTREDSLVFNKEHIVRARNFYEKHGGKAIILARFMPIIRTFAPIVAGVGEMRYRLFISYNIIGGFLWAAGISFIGYYLGSIIPGIDNYLLPIIILIIFVSILPSLVHVLKSKEDRERIMKIFIK